MKGKLLHLAIVLISSLTLIAGCTSPAPTPSPTPKASPSPTATAKPTASPSPTATAKPTASPSPTATAKPTATLKLPEFVTMATSNTGSMLYNTHLQSTQVIQDVTGLKTKLLAGVTDTNSFTGMRNKQIDFAYVSGFTQYLQAQGRDTWAKPEWGPQPVRLLWAFYTAGVTWLARNDDTVKTPYDLKGKKIPQFVGNTARQMVQLTGLAFAGIKESEVTWVPAVTLDEAAAFVKQGKADAFVGNSDSAYALDMQASPSGVRVIELDPKDTAGWKRLQDAMPFLLPYQISAGVIPKGETRWSFGYFGTWSSYDWLDDAIAYNVAKGLVEGYPKLSAAGMQIQLKEYTLENALAVQKIFNAPYHPGAVRYFKEIGKWTPELEAWQNKMLAAQSQAIKDWQQKYPKK